MIRSTPVLFAPRALQGEKPTHQGQRVLSGGSGRNVGGRVPDASHTIGFEGTDAPRRVPGASSAVSP
eukprot:gene6990-biopygen23972